MNLSGIRDVNELKRLLAMGAISQDQLNNSNISGSFGGSFDGGGATGDFGSQNALQALAAPQMMAAMAQSAQQPPQAPPQQPQAPGPGGYGDQPSRTMESTGNALQDLVNPSQLESLRGLEQAYPALANQPASDDPRDSLRALEQAYPGLANRQAGEAPSRDSLRSLEQGIPGLAQQSSAPTSSDDLRRQGAQFVRNETTGQTIYFGPNGQTSDRPTYGSQIQSQSQSQAPRMMKVIGAGGGTRVDLSPEQAPDKVNLDYSRSPYELIGGAKAIYSKDEPGTAYVMGSDGRPTAKIILGYDMQGSMALNKANAEMAKTQADTAHTQEETRVSQVNNPDFSSGGGAPGSLGSLDAGTAATVKQMLEGRMPFPGNMALRNPRVMQLLNIANQVDPNFDAATWKRRADTTDEFSKGKSFQSINALNTVSGHLDTFDKAVDALNNTNYPSVNAVINPIAQQLGSTKQTDFATTLKTLAPELERAYRGAGGSESSIEAWRTALSGNNGYDQQKSAIRQLAGLLHSKIDALGYSYSQGMNKTSNGYDLLSPQAQTVFSKLSGMNAAPQSGGQVQQPQSNIPAGAISFLRSNPASRYDFDRKYGQGASAQVLGNG